MSKKASAVINECYECNKSCINFFLNKRKSGKCRIRGRALGKKANTCFFYSHKTEKK